MVNLRLVLADFDNRYLERLTDYINSAYPTVKVIAFTRPELLHDYLRSSAGPVNILLAHPEFLRNDGSFSGIELVVALSDGNISCCAPDRKTLFKYRPGDELLSSLINLYAEKKPGVSALATGDKTTRLIAVFSAAGGAGKTSVTLGLAAKAAETGSSVLVLSMESISSMASVLPLAGNDGMSYLLLNLAESPELLPVKLEKCKTRDSRLNIDFIEPPVCFLEVADTAPGDMARLLTAVQEMGKYDLILVDMDSAADKRMEAVFSCCDRIVLVRTSDRICHLKTVELLKQLGNMPASRCPHALPKTIPLLNKYGGGPAPGLAEFGLQADMRVPLVNDLWLPQDGRCVFDPGGRFTECLGGLVKLVTMPVYSGYLGSQGKGGRENAG